MQQTFCPSCKLPIYDNFIFCPNCGSKLKDVVFSISVGKQIGLYLLSALLPPLGLFPGIKYLKNSDSKAKQVGAIAIILTILSSVITIWLTVATINSVNSTIDKSIPGFDKQLMGL